MHKIPVIGFETAIQNEWSLSTPHGSITIDRLGRSRLANGVQEPLYLIHAADPEDFKRLRPGQGVLVETSPAFLIDVALQGEYGANFQALLLEYDASGIRVGTTPLPNEAPSLYVPRRTVKNIVLTIRLAGAGALAIQRLRFTPLDAPTTLPIGLHPIAQGTPSPIPRASDITRDALGVESAARRLRESALALESHLGIAGGDFQEQASRIGGARDAMGKVRNLLVAMAQSIPDSNGSRYFQRPMPYRVAIITDEYMYNFYRDVFAEIVYATPDNYADVIGVGFDLLLYVTCWKGMHDEEWRGVTYRQRPAEALDALLAYCAENRKTSVFQSIEDPSNFEHFVPLAQKFDHVFTSDADCIDRYRAVLGHDRVYYGEYGVNPQVNNPIGSRRYSINGALFAGSYPERYPERCRDMEVIFDSVLEVGQLLYIFDRNAKVDGLEFPLRYRSATMDPVSHDLLQKMHKLFRYSLNFNSIQSSPTMCAMRVYELQAQGKGVLSNYARSVLNTFPEIRLLVHPEDLNRTFREEWQEDEGRANETLIRNVMTSRTTFDIVGRMLKTIGLDDHGVLEQPHVTLYGEFNDEHLREEMDAQTYPNLTLRELDQHPDDCESDSAYWGVVSKEYSYAENYVTDRINAFKFVDADFITQSGPGHSGAAHEYVTARPLPPLTIHASDRIQPYPSPWDPATHDRLGYMLPPYEAAPRESMHSVAPALEVTAEPELSVVVPVFNNGRFLLAKCFASLLRNARFERFEVILVDDGSTDGMTDGICRTLAMQYPNVHSITLQGPPSGSASRARNAGVAAASAALVSFLDPDNEISDGGYDAMLDLLPAARQIHRGLGFVSGFQVKVSGSSTVVTGRHTDAQLDVECDARARFFEKGRFPVISTQAAVIDKALLGPGKLEFVEGAAGQDTLYGWQLLLAADAVAFTSQAHLVYYAERSDSVTNTVDIAYFKKKLVMERAQVAALQQLGLLELYTEHHLQNFVDGWYMPKLESVEGRSRIECEDVLREILALYNLDFSALVARSASI